MCSTSPFVSYVNLCILSNKIQLVRPFWAVSVTHFLCCDCSEDRVALTTVRSPNKISPKNPNALFFLKHFVPFSSTSDFRESCLEIPNHKRFSLHTEAERVALQLRTGS